MSKKRLARTLIGTALFVALSLAYYALNPPAAAPNQAQSPAAPGTYRVQHVVDGDTIEVDMTGKAERIRMIGIDTPETKKPNAPVQCFGPEASKFATQMLGNASVRLEADPIGDNRDRYDRLLRYVYLSDGRLFNQLVIEQGYGFAYLSFPFSKHEAFAAAQKTAQAERKGLWAVCEPTVKSGNRWQSNDQE